MTASGKTRLACELATPLGAEVIACDAMTVYQGMEIGTAAPSPQQQAEVRHHLLGITNPSEPMTVSDFATRAKSAVAEIASRGKTPMIVGGSGLYLRATLDGLSFPPTDVKVRSRLEELPPDEAISRLQQEDPASAKEIDLANSRRVVRALEVIELTGRPFSSFRSEWEQRAPVKIVGIQVAEEELEARIRARAEAMLPDWLEEAEALHAVRDRVLATGAIGYKEMFSLVDEEISRAEALDRICTKTRRLSKRQMTWFKADPRIEWMDGNNIADLASKAEAYFQSTAQL